MQELNNRITGDWSDITKSALKIRELIQYFGLTPEDLSDHMSGLKFAVESGIAEYKTGLLNPMFTTLEEMKFKSLSFDELRAKSGNLNMLIFLVLIQRLFASGSLTFSFAKDTTPAAQKQHDINLIIADVLARIRENPEYKNKPAVKMILTQIFIYKRERETMQKLSPNIKDKKKAESFYRNFRTTFANIFENIQKNYSILIHEEKTESLKDIEKNILANIRLKELLPLYTKQAREFARIRSVLTFALEDKYKTREILVNLAKQKEVCLKLIEQEISMYKKLCSELEVPRPAEYALRVSLALAVELGLILEKLTQKEETETEMENQENQE
jgi:hypothetical protein